MENVELKDQYGNIFITNPVLVSGPYVGTSSVGDANVQWFQMRINEYNTDMFLKSQIKLDNVEKSVRFTFKGEDVSDDVMKNLDVIFIKDEENTQIFINANTKHQKLVDIINSLDEDPIIDINIMTDIIQEWELEAWNMTIKYDLIRECEKIGLFVNDICSSENMSDKEKDEILYDAYHKALDMCNVEPEIQEYRMVFVDCKKIARQFYQNVCDAFADKTPTLK